MSTDSGTAPQLSKMQKIRKRELRKAIDRLHLALKQAKDGVYGLRLAITVLGEMRKEIDHERQQAGTAPQSAEQFWRTLPHCVGYPSCDGDLEAMPHDEGCPLFGKKELGMWEFAEAYAASLRAALEEKTAELEEIRHELLCCDDIRLDQPLVGIVSDLQEARGAAEEARATAEAEVARLKAALAESPQRDAECLDCIAGVSHSKHNYGE